MKFLCQEKERNLRQWKGGAERKQRKQWTEPIESGFGDVFQYRKGSRKDVKHRRLAKQRRRFHDEHYAYDTVSISLLLEGSPSIGYYIHCTYFMKMMGKAYKDQGLPAEL